MYNALLNTYPPKNQTSFCELWSRLQGGRGRFWNNVNGEYWSPDVTKLTGYWLGTFRRYLRDSSMQERKEADVKLLDLILVHTKTSPWFRHARKFGRSCAPENTKRRSKVRFNELFLEAVNVLVSQWKETLKVETLRHQQSTVSRNCTEIHIKLPAEDPQTCGEDMFGSWFKSLCGTQHASHIWQLDHVNVVCGEAGGFRGGNHSEALSLSPHQDGEWQCMVTTSYFWQMTTDLNKSTVFSYQHTLRKTWGNTLIRRVRREVFC